MGHTVLFPPQVTLNVNLVRRSWKSGNLVYCRAIDYVQCNVVDCVYFGSLVLKYFSYEFRMVHYCVVVVAVVAVVVVCCGCC